MVVQRSRKWVKDRLPAFICRDTNWWVTRWIQCNVLLCPECRKEYRSLKSVWDKLDQWQVEEPEEKVESCFIENFRQKYPGAYDEKKAESAVSGFWIPKVASLCVIALLGVAVFWQAQVSGPENRNPLVGPSMEVAAVHPQSAETSAPPALPDKMEVAVAPSPRPEPIPVESVVPAPHRNGRVSSSANLPPQGTRFRITSTLDPVSSSQPLHYPSWNRTVEINDMPVSGFESLTRPYEEERPY